METGFSGGLDNKSKHYGLLMFFDLLFNGMDLFFEILVGSCSVAFVSQVDVVKVRDDRQGNAPIVLFDFFVLENHSTKHQDDEEKRNKAMNHGD